MDRIADVLDALRRRVTELERRIGAQSRTGTIAEVDAATGVARVRLQDGDVPFLTDWLAWEELAAGANKTHNPPSVGQQVKVVSESGDLHDATIQASVNSDANPRPSAAGDEYVLASVGEARITITGGGSAIVLQVGASKATLTGGEITMQAPMIRLND